MASTWGWSDHHLRYLGAHPPSHSTGTPGIHLSKRVGIFGVHTIASRPGCAVTTIGTFEAHKFIGFTSGGEECKEYIYIYIYMGVSKNRGTPKSCILIGFSIINHPFSGTPIFGNTHIYIYPVIWDNVISYIPSWELTYTLLSRNFRVDDFPFPQGYVRCSREYIL